MSAHKDTNTTWRKRKGMVRGCGGGFKKGSSSSLCRRRAACLAHSDASRRPTSDDVSTLSRVAFKCHRVPAKSLFPPLAQWCSARGPFLQDCRGSSASPKMSRKLMNGQICADVFKFHCHKNALECVRLRGKFVQTLFSGKIFYSCFRSVFVH